MRHPAGGVAIINHDALFKSPLGKPRILASFFRTFVPKAYRYVDTGHFEYLDKERFTLSGRRRTGDLLVKTRFRGSDTAFLIHLEHQAQKDVGLPWRLLEYVALDHRETQLPVYPVAVVTHEEDAGGTLSPLIVDFPDARVLEFRFVVIELARLQAESYLKKGPAAATLSARMRFAERDVLERVLKFAVAVAGTDVTDEERDTMLDYFSTYQELGPGDALKFEERAAIVHPESVRSKVMSWERQFIRAGELKGLQQGIAQGLREGEATVVLRQLRRKFGTVSSGMESTIRGLSTEQLEELAEAVLDFETAADLERWLASRV